MAKAGISANVTQHWRKVVDSLLKKRVKLGIQTEKFIVSAVRGSMQGGAHGRCIVLGGELGACCILSKAALIYTGDFVGVTCINGARIHLYPLM